MPGNSKTKRKSAGIRKTSQYKGAALPTLDVPPDASTLKQLADLAFNDLNKIIDGTGNMKNWMGVMYRLHVGYYAAQQYFEYTIDIHDCLYRAIVALRCTYIRTRATGEMGFLMWEFDAIKAALDLTSELMRHLRLSENKAVHYMTEDYFKALTEENMKSYPQVIIAAQERSAMVATLQQEMAAVANQPDPQLEEAA